MDDKITISYIAKLLELTPATVSRALNNHPRISEKTRKIVSQKAEELNYRKNQIASSLQSGKSNIIGIIIPSAQMNFFGSVVHGVEIMASEHGYHVFIYQSEEKQANEKKGIEAFLRARVDGILASIAKDTIDFSHFKEVKSMGVPIVFFDRSNDSLGIPSVVIDDHHGAFQATQHLIEQGFTRIAHVSGPQHLKICQDRYLGYMAALNVYNIPINPAYIVEGNLTIESGKEATKKLLELLDIPDAIFAVEDFTALGVLKELKERKIKVPEQIGLIGFANESCGEYITPSLSTIDQQTVNMGKEAFKLILNLINNKHFQDASHVKIVLQPINVFRESSIKKNT